jgi:tRNA 2-thiouridine synthesizing protein A
MSRVPRGLASSQKGVEEIDARGLNCPMPVMLLRKTLSTKSIGHEAVVHVTDSRAVKDFETYCRNTGDSIIKVVTATNFHSIHVRKG